MRCKHTHHSDLGMGDLPMTTESTAYLRTQLDTFAVASYVAQTGEGKVYRTGAIARKSKIGEP